MTDTTLPKPAGELSAGESLTKDDDVSPFDCGKTSLNDCLKLFALTHQNSDAARTSVIHRGGRVVGYYSLTAGSIGRHESPARVAKGLAAHPLGVIFLTRLTVDRGEQGTGIRRALLVNVLTRCVEAAAVIRARAVLVHALDERAAAFYRRFGFEPSSLNPNQFLLLMKDLRATLKSLGH